MNFKVIAAIGASIMLIATAGCEVKKTAEGEMPDVEVKGGQLPSYDVKTPDVDVHMEKKEIEVPTVDVTPASETDKK
jgi:hypothetical protein